LQGYKSIGVANMNQALYDINDVPDWTEQQMQATNSAQPRSIQIRRIDQIPMYDEQGMPVPALPITGIDGDRSHFG
jgi:hypothetical protein